MVGGVGVLGFIFVTEFLDSVAALKARDESHVVKNLFPIFMSTCGNCDGVAFGSAIGHPLPLISFPLNSHEVRPRTAIAINGRHLSTFFASTCRFYERCGLPICASTY
ncbi:hypothetical protein EVAR_47532_1 [Eumeta japonica]|uniref:Uncharacterized protein n=1 Tax=Eumeta variegata TaxID=151549 RepID=A0A4C1XSP4_EUMVA|nr:hypothetical protein EVAR_47532_1 [Eumeta japonica]